MRIPENKSADIIAQAPVVLDHVGHVHVDCLCSFPFMDDLDATPRAANTCKKIVTFARLHVILERRSRGSVALILDACSHSDSETYVYEVKYHTSALA